MSVTRVSASSSNQTLLASNTARRSASIFNDSAAVLNLICSGTNASATALTVKVGAGGLFVPPYQYVGTLKGIWPTSGNSTNEIFRLPTGFFALSYESSSRATYRQISTTVPIYGSGYTVGERIGDGAVYANGMVFAMSFGGSGANIYKWADPTNPASVTSANVDFVNNSYATLAYDATTGLLYTAGVYSFSPNLVDIYSIDPTTLAVTNLVSGQALTGAVGINSPLTTDGTYLYFMAGATAVNCTIYKFALSDGSLVTSHQLGNQPGGALTTNGNCMAYDSSFLYCGGGGASFANSWIAKVPVSLASDTVASLALNLTCDDMAVVGTDVWIGSEDPSLNGKIAQISMSALSPTYYTLGIADGINGIFYGSDGYLWVGRLSSWRVEQVDPATGSIVNTYTNAAQVTEN